MLHHAHDDDHANDDEGLGLVELVIAMFLLAIIAVALLPALWNGILYSSQQSSVATATRQLYSIVEDARQDASCVGLVAAAAPQDFTDGRGGTFTTSGAVGTCTAGTAVSLTLTAVQNGTNLASVSALVRVP